MGLYDASELAVIFGVGGGGTKNVVLLLDVGACGRGRSSHIAVVCVLLAMMRITKGRDRTMVRIAKERDGGMMGIAKGKDGAMGRIGKGRDGCGVQQKM